MNDYTVLIGNGVYCLGCGKFNGIICVSADGTGDFPDKHPVWPFEEAICPICKLIAENHELKDRIAHPRGSFAEMEKKIKEKE